MMKKIFTIKRSNLKGGNYKERITEVKGKSPKERDVESIADVLKLLLQKDGYSKEAC